MLANAFGSGLNPQTLTFTSWNCRGLGKAIKRGKVFAHLKSLSSDIIFLQETHIHPTEQRRLRAQWVSHVYQSTFSSNARGVAILVRRSIPFVFKSMVSDPGGRFILVTGTINSVPLALLNIYAPNFDNPDFFCKVFRLAADQNNHNIIIGGDFNCFLDPQMDRSSATTAPSLKSVPILNNLVKSLNLVDIWRHQHPLDKQYSFFSQVHGSFSRIDYFLIDSNLISNVVSSVYNNILISDHSPLCVKIDFNLRTHTYNWKYNPALNLDKTFSEFITAKISDFLEFNDNGMVSDSVLWETFKVVMRGNIISYQSFNKRARQKRLSEINAQLPLLEESYRASKSEVVLNDILEAKLEYGRILGEQVCNYIRKLKQKQFELGDKADSVLARQLKGIQAERAIYKISSSNGEIITEPLQINNVFYDYYRNLYASKTVTSREDMLSFLNALDIPSLNETARQQLDADFTLAEIKSAIRAFPSGKACGPDGFGIEFYKAHIDKLAPLLLRMFNSSLNEGTFPETLYDANICLLLKKGRDDTNAASYRPLSLLNSDQKIIAKVLTNRLNEHIGILIHSDQTGFIPNRFSFSNTRRLLNVIYSTRLPHSAVISLDAQQAFDQIEWEYMFSALQKFGFGDRFMTIIKMLYAHPKSCVLTNNNKSPSFLLHRGTRQGCCLSPILFALALEPLAIAIRANLEIAGIRYNTSECTIGLYADDVVLTLSDIKQSISPLLELLKVFGQFSGFTINWEKSVLMPLSDHLDAQFLHNLPFKVATEHFEYLGINIPRNPKLIFKLNFLHLMNKIKVMIDKWKLLPISLLGRVNIVKMVILPKFIYLFQNLPIFLTVAFFKLIDSVLNPFIWANKTPRISKAYLQKPASEGGFGLPVMRHYYWACNARAWVFWHENGDEREQKPCWPAIESHRFELITGGSLSALLFSKVDIPMKMFKNDFVLRNSYRIMKQIRRVLKLPDLSIYAPICLNPAFKPAMLDSVFMHWSRKGLSSIKDLYIGNHFASFAQLQNKFVLPSGHFYRYLQVRHFVRQSLTQFEQLQPQHNFYELLRKPSTSKHLISQFVSLFYKATPSAHIKDAWVNDIGIDIPVELWVRALGGIKSCSINARLQLIQYKVIHRLYYSKAKLNKIFPSVSPMCDRCKTNIGTLGHLFYMCPVLTNFWSGIFCMYNSIYNVTIMPDVLIVLLGCSDQTSTLPSSIQQAIKFGMVIAKRVILREWKAVTPPSIHKWLNDMTSCLYLEEIRYNLSDQRDKFVKTWGPFMVYIRQKRIQAGT